MNTQTQQYAASAEVDPVALMEALQPDDGLLFERFDPTTRARSHTILVLRWTASPARDLRNALSDALAAGARDADALHIVLIGSAGGRGGALLESWLADAWFVARADEIIEIDWKTGDIRHTWPADASPCTPSLDDPIARSMRPAAEQAIVRSDAAQGWQPDADSAGYAARVKKVQQGLAEGAVRGAVLSLGQVRVTHARPLAIYRQMALQNPSTYGYSFRLGNLSLIGSSPLTYLRFDRGSILLETDAGTRPVTGNASRDLQALQDLQTNDKDAAEHQVVVDAEMQALLPLALDGKIFRLKDREVRRFSHVMHLYTVLQARLRHGLDLGDALCGVFPPAAVSGHPKQQAWDLGHDVEGGERGPYGGVLGILKGDAQGEFAVVIRSLWMRGDRACIRTGGKVVPHSDPASEYREALAKARFLIDSVDRAEQSSSAGPR